MNLTRKRFFESMLGGSAVLLLSSCGGGYSGGGTPTSSCSASISTNHGHALPIAVADLDSTTDRSYNIAGSGDHSHSVTLSVAQLQQLKAGTMVTIMSTQSIASATTSPHTHSLNVWCIIY